MPKYKSTRTVYNIKQAINLWRRNLITLLYLNIINNN